MDILTEGAVKFFASQGKISKDLEVFYNPVMKFNRDVTIALLNSIDQKDIQVCDLMAGSGVRTLRFLKELNEGVLASIVANDYSENFKSLMQKNLDLNSLRGHDRLQVTTLDANKLLLESSGFDYIDIDPFGSPNDFLENSIVRLSRKGILAVTATDTAPLAGTHPATCMRKYWAKPLRNHMMHEIGLRILIRKCQLVATPHDKALIPIYSYYRDHYFRIIFRCVKGKEKCDETLKQHKYVLTCSRCLRTSVSDFNAGRCDDCGIDYDYAGPMWIGPLCDNTLSSRILTEPSVHAHEKFLGVVAQETALNLVGFYDVHQLARLHKFAIPNYESLLDSIRQHGFVASRTHFSEHGIKSDITAKELIGILKK